MDLITTDYRLTCDCYQHNNYAKLLESYGQWRSNRGFSRFKEPGPRPLGAPDRGHSLFYLEDAKNQDSEETEIRSFAFSTSFLFATFYQDSSVYYVTTCMKLCANILGRNIHIRFKFSCVR